MPEYVGLSKYAEPLFVGDRITYAGIAGAIIGVSSDGDQARVQMSDEVTPIWFMPEELVLAG